MSLNNKRKNDSNNDNDDIYFIDKSQKLDNNTGETIVDIPNLSKITVVQLLVIADSLAVLIKNGTKKSDIVDKITVAYKRKQEMIAKKEYDSNLNSFNKGVIELSIKDGIEASEWLFWKVFRNKFIYKRIMSNMNTHFVSYDSIISVEEMIRSKQFGILRDKVVRNQYLVFNNSNLHQFFDVFRNNDVDDILFYQCLFKYYGGYSMDFNKAQIIGNKLISKENGREVLVDTMITSSCLPAIKVMVQNCKYIPTISNLNNAVKLDNQQSLKIVKYLLQPQFNLREQCSGKLIIVNISNIKLLSYLYVTEQLLNIKSIPLRRLKGLKVDSSTTLKPLILICKLILKFKNHSMESTESNSLTKQELKLKLSDTSFRHKEFIKGLLDCYFQFNSVQNKPHFYYLYFEENNNGISITPNKESTIEDYQLSFIFGNFKILESFSNSSRITILDYWFKILCPGISKFKKPDFLFLNCPDKSKQMEFIDQVVKSIKASFNYIDPTLFFYLIVYNDDLDQIKFVSKELGFKITVNSCKLHYIITHYIKSTLVLDWLFGNYFSHFTIVQTVWHFSNVELLKHYELIYYQRYGTVIINCSIGEKILETDSNYSCCKVPILKHIFKCGPAIYHFNQFNFYTFIYNLDIDVHNSNQVKFEMCKLVYLNYRLSPFSHLSHENIDVLILISKTVYYIKFIDWLYGNFKDQCFTISTMSPIVYQLLLRIGKYNEITIPEIFLHAIGHSKTDDIELLDYYLTNPSFPKTGNLIGDTIKDCIKNGKLKSIQHIQHNYGYLLKPVSTSNPNGVFESKELHELLLISIGGDHLKLSQYLFELFTIAKTDFEQSSNNLSKFYFRNKYSIN